ncbi:DUF1559 domain-containing protein [Symmachiella dynata]|uniref:DUF1559 domain-containing protein n=1 Tax=Symmachiella dynata TaxID=2527995 RepID=UPI0030ED7D76
MHSFLRFRPLAAVTLATCLLATSAGTAAAQADPKLNLDHIPDQAVGAVFLFPQTLAAKPELELLPTEVIAAAGKRDFGFNPMEIEQAIALIAPPMGGNPPSWGLILHFSAPQDLSKDLTRRTESREINDVKYFSANHPRDLSFCLYKEKTILIAPESFLTLMIANQPAESELRTLLSQSATDANATGILAVEPVRDLINQALVGAPPMPPPIQQLLTLPDHLDSVHIGLNISPPDATFIRLAGRDEKSAEEVERILTEAVAFAKQMFIAQSTMSMRMDEGAVAEATLKYLARAGDVIENKLKPVREGDNVTISATFNPAYSSSAVLAGLLLPAVQQAREAARRAETRNKLKQLGLAMHNYHDVFSEFPAHANYEKKKPLLSWRVHVLPYLDQAALYQKFHLDEPWDSEHNKALIKEMPPVYQNPNMNNKDFKTNYLLVTGEDAAFFGEEGMPIRQFTDGTSNTILAVEANEDQAVIWTKPDDWEFDEENPFQGLGQLRQGGFFALFADGSVQFISLNVDEDTMRAFVTPGGGEVIQR